VCFPLVLRTYLAVTLIGALAATAVAQDANDVPEALNFANALLAKRRYDVAADQYEKFLQANPNDPHVADAEYGLATSRLFLGQYAKAREMFEAFLKAAPPDHPNAPTAWFRVGETSYMLNDLPASKTALEKYTGENPKHRHLETAWPYLGDVCLRLGDLPGARKAYEEAVALFPMGRLLDRSRYGLARTLAAQKEPEAALKLFHELAQTGGPEWSDKARYQIGLLHAAADRPEEAAAAFADLEAASPNSPMIPEARLHRAEALVKLGQFEEAEAILKPLAAADGELAPQAAYALGDSLARRKETAAALATWNDAIERFPSSSYLPPLLFRSAEALNLDGKSQDAQKRFLAIVKNSPKHPWADLALLRAAEIAVASRDLPGAKSLASQFSTLFPKSPLNADARLLLARVAIAEKQPKEAITIIESLLADGNPSDSVASSARFALALAYRADGQDQKAAAMFTEIARVPEGGEAVGDAVFLLGEGHFKAGQYADAIEPLEAYLKANEKGQFADHALALLAISEQELNAPEKAAEALDRLTKEFPESKVLGSPRLRLAEAALAAKDLPRAVELFRLAATTKDEPAVRVRALSGLGWALLESKQPDDAAKMFEELLTSSPDDPLAPDAALARARALEEGGKPDEALAAYDLAAVKYADSDRAAPARLAHARLLAKTGKFADAAAEFDAFLKANPRGLSESDGADAILVDWAYALLDADKPGESDVVFQRLLDEHPQSPRTADARVNLAESAYQDGKLDEVLTLLEPLTAAGSTADPVLIQSALFRAGRTEFDQRKWAEAMAHFARLATDYPDGPLHAKARFWLAETAFQSGDSTKAEAEFASLLADPKPADSDGWWPTAQLRHLQSLVLLERWDDALKEASALKAELPNSPQMPEIDYALGRSYQGTARFDDARASYQAVISARKGAELAARAQLMRGETFFHQKNYPEALKEFFKVDLYYNAPKWQSTALLEAGKVYEQMNQPDKAISVYDDLLKRFPAEPAAEEGGKRVEALKGTPTTPTGAKSP
jgi:TolA-binding protein